ncbi:hypothetical protein MMC07_007769 [Pseudocyphellaria aurata]|nr:hypothetical protein [Pseudocyphellaria aurata]
MPPRRPVSPAVKTGEQHSLSHPEIKRLGGREACYAAKRTKVGGTDKAYGPRQTKWEKFCEARGWHILVDSVKLLAWLEDEVFKMESPRVDGPYLSKKDKRDRRKQPKTAAATPTPAATPVPTLPLPTSSTEHEASVTHTPSVPSIPPAATPGLLCKALGKRKRLASPVASPAASSASTTGIVGGAAWEKTLRATAMPSVLKESEEPFTVNHESLRDDGESLIFQHKKLAGPTAEGYISAVKELWEHQVACNLMETELQKRDPRSKSVTDALKAFKLQADEVRREVYIDEEQTETPKSVLLEQAIPELEHRLDGMHQSLNTEVLSGFADMKREFAEIKLLLTAILRGSVTPGWHGAPSQHSLLAPSAVPAPLPGTFSTPPTRASSSTLDLQLNAIDHSAQEKVSSRRAPVIVPAPSTPFVNSTHGNPAPPVPQDGSAPSPSSGEREITPHYDFCDNTKDVDLLWREWKC